MTSCIREKSESENKTTNNDKIIATWINYNEINNLIKKADTINEFNKLVERVIIKLSEKGINNIFLQVRAFDDCFYNSELTPVSIYCYDDNSKLKFDILDVFTKIGHLHNIKIHAWINPYRIRNDGNLSKINYDSFSYKFLNIESDILIKGQEYIYYNPSSVTVQKYVLDVVREILTNYKVDGIHIDDYFYPDTDESIDKISYNNYIDSGGQLSLPDFRCVSVNSLLSALYCLVKCFDDKLVFSVSPSADIEYNYDCCYADIVLWANSTGFVDYLVPQIYFGFNHKTMPFEKVLCEWMKLKNHNTKIIIGLAIYKCDKIDEYALSGKNEWIENQDIISRQIKMVDDYSADGYSYYSASYLYE